MKFLEKKHFSRLVPSHTMDLTSTRTLEWDNLGHQCDKNEDRKNDELLCVDKIILCTFESASNETLNLPQKQEKHKYYPVNFEYFPRCDIEGDDEQGDVMTDPDSGYKIGGHLYDNFSSENKHDEDKIVGLVEGTSIYSLDKIMCENNSACLLF